MKKATQTNRTVTRIALALVISLVLGVGIYTVNAKSLNGNTLPMPFGVGVAVVLSGSMEPELSVDDVIIVRAADSYDLGDVVVFQQGGDMVVHEIIHKDGDMVTTQGRANNTLDDPIHVKYIKGRVVHVFEGAGAFVNIVKSPLFTFGVLGVALWLLIRSYRTEKSAEQAELDALREEIEKLKQ